MFQIYLPGNSLKNHGRSWKTWCIKLLQRCVCKKPCPWQGHVKLQGQGHRVIMVTAKGKMLKWVYKCNKHKHSILYRSNVTEKVKSLQKFTDRQRETDRNNNDPSHFIWLYNIYFFAYQLSQRNLTATTALKLTLPSGNYGNQDENGERKAMNILMYAILWYCKLVYTQSPIIIILPWQYKNFPIKHIISTILNNISVAQETQVWWTIQQLTGCFYSIFLLIATLICQ